MIVEILGLGDFVATISPKLGQGGMVVGFLCALIFDVCYFTRRTERWPGVTVAVVVTRPVGRCRGNKNGWSLSFGLN